MKLQIIIDGKIYEVEYDTAEHDTSPSAPSVEYAQSIVLPTPGIPNIEAAEIDEAKVCRSPVAGIVTRINVEPGQSIQAGHVLLVVEAMKMENNLATPSSAKVRLLKVKVGDSVKVNQIVLEFE